jgi:hypothetical protein
MSGQHGQHTGIVWGTSRAYPSRTHVVPLNWTAGLCGLPVHDQWPTRPHGFRVCPECAIAWISTNFPTSPPRPAPSAEDPRLP